MTDGLLEIDFIKGLQKQKINAISIVGLSDGGPGGNAAPTPVDDSYATDAGAALVVAAAQGVLANDSDPDGDAMTATRVSGPSNGTLTLNADGSFDYTPDAGFSGTDSFTYAAGDGNGGSTEATATISVAGVNTAPVGIADTYTASFETALLVGAASGLLGNDADADGDALSVASIEGLAGNVGAAITLNSGATLTVNADGSFDYVPATGFSGTDSFTYTPGDGSAAGDPVTVTIDVAGGGGSGHRLRAPHQRRRRGLYRGRRHPVRRRRLLHRRRKQDLERRRRRHRGRPALPGRPPRLFLRIRNSGRERQLRHHPRLR